MTVLQGLYDSGIIKHGLKRICLCLIMASVFGCASAPVADKPMADPFHPEKILLFPVANVARIYGEHIGVLSPYSGRFFMTGETSASSEQFLDDRLNAFIRSRSLTTVLSPGQAKNQAPDLASDRKTALLEKRRLAEIGRISGADAVMTGSVYRFKDRIGNKHSVKSPASVAFELCLIKSTDASLVWCGVFNETQASLSENVLQLPAFIKRKGTWVSAEEMATAALDDLLRTFPE